MKIDLFVAVNQPEMGSNDAACCPVRDLLVCSVSCRHERIHTKRGSHMKMQTDPEEVEDLAILEVLDEVREITDIE